MKAGQRWYAAVGKSDDDEPVVWAIANSRRAALREARAEVRYYYSHHDWKCHPDVDLNRPFGPLPEKLVTRRITASQADWVTTTGRTEWPIRPRPPWPQGRRSRRPG